LALVFGVCLAASRFSLEVESVLLGEILTPAIFVIAGHYMILQKWGARPAFISVSIAQLKILFLLGSPLTYIAASADFPLQDATFAYWDQLLGLDWIAYYRFITARPTLLHYAYFFYAMITWPAMGVPLVLGFTKNYVPLQNFIMACILTVCFVALVSSLAPAFGTYHQYGLPTNFSGLHATGYLVQMDRLPLVRDGSLRGLNISHLGGIITFPSFHAAAAILALWGFWGVWWMRPLSLIASVGMIMATPLLGGHYFVDVLAGVGSAALAIAAAKLIAERFLTASAAMRAFRKQPEFMSPAGERPSAVATWNMTGIGEL
jgi:membrane-associated phospholipid phosphatase